MLFGVGLRSHQQRTATYRATWRRLQATLLPNCLSWCVSIRNYHSRIQADAMQIKALPELSFSFHIHTKPETHLLNKSGFGLRQLWPGQAESVVIVGLAEKAELGR